MARACGARLPRVIHELDAAGITRAVLAADQIGRQLAHALRDPQLGADGRRGLALHAIGSSLAVALLDRGFTAEDLPGRPISLRRGAQRFDPFGLAERVLAGADCEETLLQLEKVFAET